MLLTRAPLYSPGRPGFRVRLACVKHAASVRSEPGSNSPKTYPTDTLPAVSPATQLSKNPCRDVHEMPLKARCGATPPRSSRHRARNATSGVSHRRWTRAVKPDGRLVRVSCAHCWGCTSRLSTSWSTRGLQGDLIWGGASRLDAFSGYPGRTWLPSAAAGATTHTPEVRPSRSSRTGDGVPQVSCAHDR